MKTLFFKSLFILLWLSIYHKTITGQIITTVAGGATGHGGYWGDGGPATLAQLERGSMAVIDNYGNIYIGDKSRILKVDRLTGIITTAAGTGILGYNGDNIPATTAKLNWASYSTFDDLNNLYIGDGENYRMRKVDAATGMITTFAGNGILGSNGDGGPATAAEITGGDVTWDAIGNFYFTCKRKVRKVLPSGIVTTIAGTGLPGVTGEGVLATATNVSYSQGIALDRSGNIYFSDSTGAVRKVNVSTGIITRVAGTGDNVRTPYSGDGIPATTCHISPLGLDVDQIGNLYFADAVNHRVVMVDTFGMTHTVAGTGISGFSGDGGSATSAKLWAPQYVKLDDCGNVFIADYGNFRIRKVTMPPILTIPVIVLSAGESSSSVPLGSSVTVNATVTSAGSSYIIHWLNRGVEFSTTTVPVVTYTKAPGIDTITARVVSTATYGCYDSTTSAPHIVTVGSTRIVLMYAAGGFLVYPNPAHGTLTVSGAEGINTVAITNLLGQTLIEQKYNSDKVSVDVAALPPGMYLLRVNDVWVRRFLKE